MIEKLLRRIEALQHRMAPPESSSRRPGEGLPGEYEELLQEVEWARATVEELRRQKERLEAERGERLAFLEVAEEREARFQSLVEAMNDGLVVQDAGGLISYVNDKMCEISGLRREEVVGRSAAVFLPLFDEANQTLLKEQMERRRRAESNQYELMWRRKGGGEAYVIVSAAPFHTERGLAGSVAVVTDITPRKLAELALLEAKRAAERESREKGRLLAEIEYQVRFEKLVSDISARLLRLPPPQMDVGIGHALKTIGEFAGVDRSYLFRIGAEGSAMSCTQEWCAEGIEPQSSRLQNLPLASFPWFQKTLRSLQVFQIPRVADLPPEAWAEKEEFEREGIRSLLGVPLVREGRILGFLGFDSVREERFWQEEEITLLRVAGQITTDALELQRTEAELRTAKDQAEAANRAKGEFLALASHELRTPLNAILGYSELLLDGVEGPLTDKQRDCLSRVDQGGKSLLRLIDGILDLARLQAAQRGFLVSEPFLLSRVLADELRARAPDAQRKGLRLAAEVKPGVRDALLGDAVRLGQVLGQLLDNGIEFTKEGEVTVGVEEEPCQGGQVFLHFAVRDTGAGIPADKQGSIFEPFVQADSSTTRTHGGIGLGLALCRALVEEMGGRIWVESRPAGGSTFHFTARFDPAA